MRVMLRRSASTFIIAENAARCLRQRARRPMQCRESAARHEHEQQATGAHDRVGPRARLLVARHPMQRDRRRTEHERKEKGRPPEEEKEHIGKPGAEGTDTVLHLSLIHTGRGRRRS